MKIVFFVGKISELCEREDPPFTTGIIQTGAEQIEFHIYGLTDEPAHIKARDAYAQSRQVTISGEMCDYPIKTGKAYSAIEGGRIVAKIPMTVKSYLDVTKVEYAYSDCSLWPT